MISDLKPYPEYKESGLPWLGRVPKRWSVQRAKWRFRHRKELNAGGDHTNVLSLTLRGVVNNNPDDPEGLVPKDYRTYQFFAKGDLVFKLIDLENLRTSRVGLVHEDGIMSSAYVRLVPSNPTNMRYFFHQFYDLYSRGIYNQLGAGVRSTLGPADLLNVGIAIPLPAEQAAIVRFLDWANGRLERTIRAKRKVIALLNEQKQAIIHRTVTRGLAPSVPLKPSGIPWLGDIPQHWEAPRVKQCARKISKGTTPSTEGRDILESGPVRFLKAENISAGRITDKPFCFIDEETNRMIRRSQLAENDILFVIAGATLGKTAVVSVEVLPANTNQAVAFIRSNSRIVPTFLELWLQSPRIKELIWLNAVQSAQPNLSMADLGNFAAPVPPRNEQEQILEFVRSATKPMSEGISRLEREIELLREYRTRLVADVVTGKLDVREAAARLPDEAPLNTVEDDAGLGNETEAADEGAAI